MSYRAFYKCLAETSSSAGAIIRHSLFAYVTENSGKHLFIYSRHLPACTKCHLVIELIASIPFMMICNEILR